MARGRDGAAFLLLQSESEEDIYCDPKEIRARKSKNQAASHVKPDVGSKNDAPPTKKPVSQRAPDGNRPRRGGELNISDVAAVSTVWLAERIGPVLTARHLTRNLLRMLTLCYLDEDSLDMTSTVQDAVGGGGGGDGAHQANKTTAILGPGVACSRVRGDVSAKKVLGCLSSICGESFFCS
jgi:hypothetical protein